MPPYDLQLGGCDDMICYNFMIQKPRGVYRNADDRAELSMAIIKTRCPDKPGETTRYVRGPRKGFLECNVGKRPDDDEEPGEKN